MGGLVNCFDILTTSALFLTESPEGKQLATAKAPKCITRVEEHYKSAVEEQYKNILERYHKDDSCRQNLQSQDVTEEKVK